MKNFHPISHFIKCIDHLGIPYPEKGLKGFLSAYTESFTRETDPSLIFFNGEDKVLIEKRTEGYMSDEDIEDMLWGLLKYHKKGTNIHKRYLLAIQELSKRGVPVKKPVKIADKVKKYMGESKEQNKEPFEKIKLKNPELPEYNRWEIGISGTNTRKIRKYVENIIPFFPEFYMVKYLKEGITRSENCSKAEVYLETLELNIQNILDKMHALLDKSLAKEIMPKDCSKKPKFMTSASAILGKKGDCIFTFSQGGEEVYEYKKTASPENLEIYFDGESHYKFFGTLDVTIDIKEYLSLMDRIEQGSDIIKELYRTVDPEVFDLHRKEEGFEGDIKITENIFTELLYTDSMSIQTFRDIIRSKVIYSSVSFLHGIDSRYPIIFIMKPGFERGYVNATVAPSMKTPSKKITRDVLVKEAKNFTFRNPKRSNPDDPCKDNWSWCNSRLVVKDSVSFYDVDVVLAPYFLFDELSNINQNATLEDGTPNPFYSRIVFYGHDIEKKDFLIKGEEAYKIGLSMVPSDYYYLSFIPFTDVQKEYMERLAYYGLFKDSIHPTFR